MKYNCKRDMYVSIVIEVFLILVNYIIIATKHYNVSFEFTYATHKFCLKSEDTVLYERTLYERTLYERTLYERTLYERTLYERTLYERTLYERTLYERTFY